ncbi:hypothetical protein HK101_007326 [Irineochytrium annulatum]|nr:hypothetical protein HK101_007326 [Irineochytrium annulatum]
MHPLNAPGLPSPALSAPSPTDIAPAGLPTLDLRPVEGSHILVTGGTGYLGSHTVLELLLRGHDVVVVDDLTNSSIESLRRVERLTNRRATFHRISTLDRPALSCIFRSHRIAAVLHLAGLKSPAESVRSPLDYYSANVTGAIILLEVMREHGCKRIVFSSSATVYKAGDGMVGSAVGEDAELGPSNPYGRTKLFVEEMIRDVCLSDPNFSASILRYFNPVGSHPSAQIGEDPTRGPPANLLPYITQVLIGRRDALTVHGSDYPTRDGTGVRDYVHVVDLALAHVAALARLLHPPTHCDELPESRCTVLNIGTGRGHSVLEVVKAMERASGIECRRVVGPRRPGDAPEVVADPRKARELLGWVATRGLEEMCESAWAWQRKNPNGYGDAGEVEMEAEDIARALEPGGLGGDGRAEIGGRIVGVGKEAARKGTFGDEPVVLVSSARIKAAA